MNLYRVTIVFFILSVILLQSDSVLSKRIRCDKKDIYLGKCDGNFGSKMKPKLTPDNKNGTEENSQNTTDEKQPFVIVAADYEDEDPNDLKDAESVHGNRRPYRGPYSYHDKNNNYNDDENKRIFSLNDDLVINRNKRRGKARGEKNRQPFVISVPDDDTDYKYDDDYKDQDYKNDYYNNRNQKDDDYKDDLRKEQTSYLRDPFLLEQLNRDLYRPEYDYDHHRGGRASRWREQVRRQAAKDRAYQRRDLHRQYDSQRKQDEADRNREIAELQRSLLEMNVQLEQQKRIDEAFRREDDQRFREDALLLQKDQQEQFVDLQKNAYVHPYGSKDAPRGPPRRSSNYEEVEEDYPSEEEEDYY